MAAGRLSTIRRNMRKTDSTISLFAQNIFDLLLVVTVNSGNKPYTTCCFLLSHREVIYGNTKSGTRNA